MQLFLDLLQGNLINSAYRPIQCDRLFLFGHSMT